MKKAILLYFWFIAVLYYFQATHHTPVLHFCWASKIAIGREEL